MKVLSNKDIRDDFYNSPVKLYCEEKMKKVFLLVLNVILIAGMTANMSCEGPEGPAGPQGAQGPAGPEGEKGPAGDPGTANVLYSAWLKPTSWTRQPKNGTPYFYADFPAPRLTQAMINQADLKVYVKHPTEPGQVQSLPYSLEGVETISATFSVNNVRVWVRPSHSNPVTDLTYEFRYIIIPGGQAVRTAVGETYEEVKTQLEIPD